jgi:hypothetical protein
MRKTTVSLSIHRNYVPVLSVGIMIVIVMAYSKFPNPHQHEGVIVDAFSWSSSSSYVAHRGRRMMHYASTATSKSNDNKATSSNNTNIWKHKSSPDDIDDDDDDDDGSVPNEYPWSKVQEWALHDNLPKYMIRIPTKPKNPILSSSTSSRNNGRHYHEDSKQQQDKKNKKKSFQSYALWRSLLQDVPELSGYPVDFLQERCRERQQKQPPIEKANRDENDDDYDDDDNDNHINGDSNDLTSIGILPYLQDYEFTAQGGVCGTVYGLKGVADGSRIETSAVTNVQETLPNGYIQTSDGSAAFELGRPIGNGNEQSLVSEGWKMLSSSNGPTPSTVGVKVNSINLVPQNVDDADGLLLRLGATTGILLAGATAINMISHHMTVNVFWV